MRNQIVLAASLLLFLVSKGEAVETQPWLGNVYEFEFRSDIRYQQYGRLSTGNGLKKQRANDVFINFSLSNALPDPPIGLELEITEAFTRKQSGDIDHLKLTGRYVWLDDVAGDSVSIITGVGYTQAFKKSLMDISSFHHGLYNTEFFISLGKETSDSLLWSSRWWGTAIYAIAEQGSPWLSLRFDFQKRWVERHELALFFDGKMGLGGKHLHTHHFNGYGSVQHRSIDIGLMYRYVLDYFGYASIKYIYRPYASNFPVSTQQVVAEVLYTFGL